MELQKENRKKYLAAAVLGICLLAGAAYSEFTDSVITGDGEIERESAGGMEQEIDLTLNAEGLPKDYTYHLTVEPENINEEMAEEYFQLAVSEIDQSFFTEDDTADYVTHEVKMAESYADGLVSAEWTLDDYTYVGTDGQLNCEELSVDGAMVEAQVRLKCADFEQLYEFSFMVFPPELSEQETLLKKIDEEIQKLMSETGSTIFRLPKSVDGISLRWEEKRSYLTIKVFFFEILVLVLLKVAEAEQRQEQIKKRQEQMEQEYSELVSKLSILMGSGMPLKSAWERIVSRYFSDRKNDGIPQKSSYEEMAITIRAIKDGESERLAYQKFGERCNVPCYYRLSRLLLQNLEKGNKQLCLLLEKEAEKSFEERKYAARKKGEEAGTKMLMPLMLMMVIVIAIVVAPAMYSFGI